MSAEVLREAALGSAWEAAARHFGQRTRRGALAAGPLDRRGAAANARRISGFKSNRSILLPLRNRLNRLGPETLCHQQPVVCEIAGEKVISGSGARCRRGSRHGNAVPLGDVSRWFIRVL